MSRKMAIKAATVAVALGVLTSAALAESTELTDVQMDQVTAGFWMDSAGNLHDQYGFTARYDLNRGIYVGPLGKGYIYNPSTDTLTSLDGTTVLVGNSRHVAYMHGGMYGGMHGGM